MLQIRDRCPLNIIVPAEQYSPVSTAQIFQIGI